VSAPSDGWKGRGSTSGRRQACPPQSQEAPRGTARPGPVDNTRMRSRPPCRLIGWIGAESDIGSRGLGPLGHRPESPSSRINEAALTDLAAAAHRSSAAAPAATAGSMPWGISPVQRRSGARQTGLLRLTAILRMGGLPLAGAVGHVHPGRRRHRPAVGRGAMPRKNKATLASGPDGVQPPRGVAPKPREAA
jgi:hypothetical protein